MFDVLFRELEIKLCLIKFFFLNFIFVVLVCIVGIYALFYWNTSWQCSQYWLENHYMRTENQTWGLIKGVSVYEINADGQILNDSLLSNEIVVDSWILLIVLLLNFLSFSSEVTILFFYNDYLFVNNYYFSKSKKYICGTTLSLNYSQIFLKLWYPFLGKFS